MAKKKVKKASKKAPAKGKKVVKKKASPVKGKKTTGASKRKAVKKKSPAKKSASARKPAPKKPVKKAQAHKPAHKTPAKKSHPKKAPQIKASPMKAHHGKAPQAPKGKAHKPSPKKKTPKESFSFKEAAQPLWGEVEAVMDIQFSKPAKRETQSRSFKAENPLAGHSFEYISNAGNEEEDEEEVNILEATGNDYEETDQDLKRPEGLSQLNKNWLRKKTSAL